MGFLGKHFREIGPWFAGHYEGRHVLLSKKKRLEAGSQINCRVSWNLTLRLEVHSKMHRICSEIEYIRTMLGLCH